jgi:thiamine-monophosphate kinase
MSVGEFETIHRYFRRALPARDDVLLGIGDDAALLQIPDGHVLVTALATLSTAAWDESRGDGARLGRRVMAVAVNRLAAAGARPAWATLALTLPETLGSWLTAFSDALFAVAAPLSVALIGGDTTRGPFAVTVVAHGLMESGARQATARVRAGDIICISGGPGGGSLDAIDADGQARMALGQWIRRHAGIAADTSNGLEAAVAALIGNHHLGARIDLSRLPTASPQKPPSAAHGHDACRRRLSGHREVQLCFTLPAENGAAMQSHGDNAHEAWTRLGEVTDSGLLECLIGGGQILTLPMTGPEDRTP